MNKKNIFDYIDKVIIIFLAIQIISISFSIALSSISLGIWSGLWIIEIIYTRKIEIPKELIKEIKIICVFILLFFIVDLLSRIFAVVSDGAFYGLKRFLLYFIFLGMISKIKDRQTLNKILISALTVFTIISIYEIIFYIIRLPEAIKQTNLGDFRLYAFAYYITTGEIKMLLFISFFPLIFIKEKIFINKIYLIISLTIIFISMYLTQTRSVFLSLFICFLIYGILINRKFLVSFIILITFVLILIPSELRGRITSIIDPKHPSNESRIVMWNVGLKIFCDYPIIGVGDNEITKIYNKYKKPESHGEGSHLHSNIIMILATKGLLGFLIYISLFFTFFLIQIKYFKKIKKKEDKLLIFGCLLATISFHIAGIFEWNYGDWEVLTLLIFILTIPFILININKNEI